jgi:hypothetical protein
MAANNRRLVSGAHPWGTPSAGYSSEETDHPEVYEAGSTQTISWTDLANMLAPSSGRGVGGGACDFLQGTDLFFRPLFAFFILEWKSRKVIQVNVTRSPTDLWVARTAAGSDCVWANSSIPHQGS